MSRIALVDDDRNILTSVLMTLEAEGFEVETYNDGQSALDAFNKKLPDLGVLTSRCPVWMEWTCFSGSARNQRCPSSF